MNDALRQILQQIITQDGREMCDDPKWVFEGYEGRMKYADD